MSLAFMLYFCETGMCPDTANFLIVAGFCTVILGRKVYLAFGKTLEADLTEVLVRSVANPRALLTLASRSLSNGFA